MVARILCRDMHALTATFHRNYKSYRIRWGLQSLVGAGGILSCEEDLKLTLLDRERLYHIHTCSRERVYISLSAPQAEHWHYWEFQVRKEGKRVNSQVEENPIEIPRIVSSTAHLTIFLVSQPSAARPQRHLQQQYLPTFWGVALIDVPGQPRGAKKSGRAVLARENLLSIPVGCPAWVRCIGRRPGQSGQEQLVADRMPQPVFVPDVCRREVRPAQRASEGQGAAAFRAKAGAERAGRASLVSAQVLAQIGLATELFVAIWTHEDLGSPDTTGTAGLRHPAPQHPRRIRELRKRRLGVGQHLEAGLWGAVLVLLRPGAVPGPWVLILSSLRPAVLLPLGQERCDSPGIRGGRRWGQLPVGRGDRGCIGRCGTRFVPAAMGGEVRRAAEDLVALGAAVLDAHDAGAAVLSQSEGVCVLLLAQLADELPQRRAAAPGAPGRRPGLLLLDLQAQNRGRGDFIGEAQLPHGLWFLDSGGRGPRCAAWRSLGAALAAGGPLQAVQGGREGRGVRMERGLRERCPERQQELLPRGRCSCWCHRAGERGHGGSAPGEGLSRDGWAEAALQERPAQFHARRLRGAGAGPRTLPTIRPPLRAFPPARRWAHPSRPTGRPWQFTGRLLLRSWVCLPLHTGLRGTGSLLGEGRRPRGSGEVGEDPLG